jgi:hypothetical protein
MVDTGTVVPDMVFIKQVRERPTIAFDDNAAIVRQLY